MTPKPEECARMLALQWADRQMREEAAAAFTEALRTYGDSEYQRGRREADAELYLRGRTEALEEAAQAVRMQTTGYPALEAGLVERILSLAGAPHPSSEYQRGRGDGLEAAAREVLAWPVRGLARRAVAHRIRALLGITPHPSPPK